MINRLRLQLCLISAFVIAIMGAIDVAFAQDYPNRVIKIIVPFAPGGQPDVVARVFAQNLAVSIGATMIDNRPGANRRSEPRLRQPLSPTVTLCFLAHQPRSRSRRL